MLIVPSDVLLKFAPMYDVEAPECAGNTTSLPWNQSVKPSGSLWLIIAQSGRFVMSSNPSLMVQVPLGALTPPAEADEADDFAPWAVGDTRLLAAPAPVAATSITASAITAGKASSNAKRFFDGPNSFSLVSAGATIAPEHTLLSLSRRKTKPFSGIGFTRAGRRPPSPVS